MALDLDRWVFQGGMMAREDGEILYKEVAALPAPAYIVEIGCYEGKSTIAMLQACRDTSTPTEKKSLISVDDFSGDGMNPGESTKARREEGVQTVKDNVASWGLSGWHDDILPMTSERFFKLYNTKPYGAPEGWEGKRRVADMFFIDGCHSCVKDDMLAAWPMLRSGGVMICHDYHTADPGFFWIRDLIDGAGLGGSKIPGSEMLYRAVKP